ncbi:PREDICTED: follicle cell protein 3C-1 [Drosophila arizonae]|uniref:Follicle cell protein 3C-1 n=1 Tax=Drosophila arizonae TaxID=7263 RepID=A0ABM1PU47_DROAR|nr:PREDICTED: follicle cell protein 3C-1 [Drosophila arizonae]
MVSDQGLRRTLLLLALTFLVGQQLVGASKIAYKKPLYGKMSHFKDRRVKQRTTSSPTTQGTTQEADWPAPVEFIINSSTAKALPQEEQLESSTGSSSTIAHPSSTSTAASIIGSSTPHPEQEELEQEDLQQEPELGSSTPGSLDNTLPSPPTPAGADPQQPVPCTCGVFLTSQIKNGLPETPLIHNEMDRMYPCNAIGRKQCQTKCLETIVQHLPNSANIVCSALGHNCHKERAYLFIKNCQNIWVNTNLQAGREYCCKEGQPYRCPLLG